MGAVCLSKNANILLKEYLKLKDLKLIELENTALVYEAVSAHPDIYLCKMNNTTFVAKDALPDIEKLMKSYDIPYVIGNTVPGYKYPENISYNAVCTGKYFIHNFDYTDTALLEMATTLDLKKINVKQGYTKCNMVVVDENSAITSDVGIAKALKENGLDCLLIQQGHVILEGFEYGFLGGASGRINDEIIFNGNLETHPDYEKIVCFIESRNLKIKYFKEYPLEDIGSIIKL